MRPAESWLNEYRGRRNDGRVTNEEHLEFIRRIQADAISGARDELLTRLATAAGANAIPAWILVALQTGVAPAPVQGAITHREQRALERRTDAR